MQKRMLSGLSNKLTSLPPSSTRCPHYRFNVNYPVRTNDCTQFIEILDQPTVVNCVTYALWEQQPRVFAPLDDSFMIQYDDQSIYRGEMDMGLRNGRGVFFMANGRILEG